MKKQIYVLCVVCVMTFFVMGNVLAKNTEGKALPEFTLKDPVGKSFGSKDLVKEGLILVVTAPILSNKGAQEGWDKELTDKALKDKATLVFLEDMGPSSFPKMALKSMKKDYRPGKEPILLIDENGKVRKLLGVEEKQTVVLVYNKKGRLVHSETAKPSAPAAREIWAALKK